jgi:hypothetical protein
MSLISAITSKGHTRFMVRETGGVNAEVFIEFLKRLLVGARKRIFLIVDRGPAHTAKKTKAFVETESSGCSIFRLIRRIAIQTSSPGAVRNSVSARAATASSACSQLSSMINDDLFRRWDATAASG